MKLYLFTFLWIGSATDRLEVFMPIFKLVIVRCEEVRPTQFGPEWVDLKVHQ